MIEVQDTTFGFEDDADVVPTPIVSEQSATFRANRYNVAAGPELGGYDAIYKKVMAGAEQELRAQGSAMARTRTYAETEQTIAAYVQQAKDEDRRLGEADFRYFQEIRDPAKIDEKINPETFMEKQYVKNSFEMALKPNYDEDTELDPVQQKLQSFKSPIRFMSKEEESAYESAANFATKRESAYRLAQEIQDKYDATGYTDTGVAIAKTFIPFYTEWKTNDLFKDVDGLLNGENIDESIRELYNIQDPTEFSNTLNLKIKTLFDANPVLGKRYADAVIKYSDSDQFIDNIGTIAEIAAAGTGVIARKLVAAVGRKGSVPAILAATGKEAEAAFLSTKQALKTLASGTGAARGSMQNLMEAVPPLGNPLSVLSDVGNYSARQTQMLQDNLNQNAEAFLRVTGLDSAAISRLEPGTPAYLEALKTTQDFFFAQYPTSRNSIMAVRPIKNNQAVVGGADYLEFQIGTSTALRFKSLKQAELAKKTYGVPSAVVKGSDRDGFYLAVTKAVDETAPTVRAQLITPTNATPKATLITKLFEGKGGGLKAKDDILPTDINQAAKATVFGSVKLRQLGESVAAEALGKIPNRWWKSDRKEFMNFLEHQRDNEVFSPTLGDFERDYLAHTGRAPSIEEAQGYFAYRQVNDAEYFINNLEIWKQKSRLGLENFAFKMKTSPKGLGTNIEGRIRLEIPWSAADDFDLMVINESGVLPTFVRKKYSSQTERAYADDLIKNKGYKLVQVSDQGQRALPDWAATHGLDIGKRRPSYVLIKDIETKPLGYHQLPHKAGGHMVYKDPFYVAQPKVTQVNAGGGKIAHDYYGDTNLWNARTAKEAADRANTLNVARELYRAGKKREAKNFVQANLPVTYRQFVQLFKPSVKRNPITGLVEKSPARFDIDTPFYSRSNGKTIEAEHGISRAYTARKEEFNDALDNQHSVYNDGLLTRFTGERDPRLQSVRNAGTDDSPQWVLENARLLDPYQTLRSGYASMANSRFASDLKIKSAERYVQEFGRVLEGDADEIARYPLRALMTATFKDTLGNKAEVAAAKNFRRAVMELVSNQPKQLIDLDHYNTKVMGLLGENKFKSGRAGDVLEFVATSDPVQFLRYWLGFLPRMGFYAPKQLFLQAQGVAATTALAGAENASKGFAAAWLMRGVRFNGNKKLLEGVAEKASAVGWKKKDFIESYEAMVRSGFDNVGDEYAEMTNMLSQTSLTGLRKAADKSLFFFKKGEKINRLTAWNASYQKWRTEFPIAKFDNLAQQAVLEQADMFTNNMTRASSAVWQQGALSVPTQFWSYQARLMDLMWSGRIETPQRIKLVLMNTALYGGVTGTAGTVAGLYPWHQAVRQELIEEGVDINEDVFTKLLVDGIPQTMAAYALGEDINFSERFGPSGLTILKDLFDANKSTVEVVTGALGSSVANMFNAAQPVVSELGRLYAGDSKLTMSDWQPVISTISSLGQAEKAYVAFTYGKYFTKDGTDVIKDDVSGAGAAFIGILGLLPQDVDDFYGKINTNKTRETVQNRFSKEAIRYIRMSYEGDYPPEERAALHRKAISFKEAGDFTEEQWNRVMRNALANDRTRTKIEQLDEEIAKGSKKQMSINFDRESRN